MNTNLNNSNNTTILRPKFMKNYFKSDVLDSLYVIEEEIEEQLMLDNIWFYVKYYHTKTRGYWSINNGFMTEYYHNQNKVGFSYDNEPNTFYAIQCLSLGYARPLSIDLEENLYNDVEFCIEYKKQNSGNVVFIRSNNYKELVPNDSYNYRVNFFDENGNRVKELHAFATKDYCVNAYKKWHQESFEIVDLSNYKYIYAISFNSMNLAVCHGVEQDLHLLNFDSKVHVNDLIINSRQSSYIYDLDDEVFVDLSNDWQIIATNEPIHSISVDKNNWVA